MSNVIPNNQEELKELRKGCLLHPSLIGKKGSIDKASHNIRYWYIYAGSDGNRKRCRGHRLIWIEKNGEIPKDLQVLHNCGQSLCLNIEHLRLGTQKDNVLDAVKHGTMRNHHKKIGDLETYKLICERYRKGITQVQIAKEYGVGSTAICRIVNKYMGYFLNIEKERIKEQIEVLKKYLFVKIYQGDLHGGWDCCIDIQRLMDKLESL